MLEKFSSKFQRAEKLKPGEEQMEDFSTQATNKALRLREEIRRQEEFVKKLSTVSSNEEKLSLMEIQQESALERNKRELEKIKKNLKSTFGIELPE